MGVGGIWGRDTSDAGDKLGEPGKAHGLAILTMRTREHRTPGEGEQPFSRCGRERPATRKASALNPGHFEQVPNLVRLAINFHQIELSGVGHGPLLFATGPGCLGGES